MKNFKQTPRLAVLSSLLLAAMLSTGCMRLEVGEDIDQPTETEISVLKRNLTYIKDQHGNCFAILDNHTSGFRSTFTMASVSCESIGNITGDYMQPCSYTQ